MVVGELSGALRQLSAQAAQVAQVLSCASRASDVLEEGQELVITSKPMWRSTLQRARLKLMT